MNKTIIKKVPFSTVRKGERFAWRVQEWERQHGNLCYQTRYIGTGHIGLTKGASRTFSPHNMVFIKTAPLTSE